MIIQGNDDAASALGNVGDNAAYVLLHDCTCMHHYPVLRIDLNPKVTLNYPVLRIVMISTGLGSKLCMELI
jgi:hypothetical protein